MSLIHNVVTLIAESDIESSDQNIFKFIDFFEQPVIGWLSLLLFSML